ncbi:hypothetical protein NKH75_07145 [Mesorhizobium sp. M0984]|uniref:hypothetical protein n=1 Tax=Mesorhizobium sp. M0984 TaxID=2957041 RepID=UPI00333BC591
MATIPLQIAERRLDTGNVVQYPQGGDIGRAVQSAGNDFTAVAERVRQRQDEMDKFKRISVENEFDQATANQAEELARSGPADGSGLHDTIAGQVDPSGRVIKPGLFDNLAKQYRDRVPESQRGYFDASLPAKRLQLSGNAATAQYTQEQKYATIETGKIQDGLLNSILQMDPNDSASYEAYKAKGHDAIVASPLSPLAKKAALDGWDQSAPKALAQAIGARDPGKLRQLFGMAAPAAIGGSAVNVVTDKIIGVESGGDANAENPNSSASGVGQFLDSTWVQTVRQHRPDIAAGKSAAQLIALKKDRTLGREMTKAYQQDNADYLANRGEATTPGNIYLAHFLGPGGAVNVLKADPNTPIVNVVGQDVVRANPFLAGKTVADTIAWSDKKIGGAGVSAKPDPRFAGLAPDDRLALANADDVAFRQKQAGDVAQAKVDYQAYKDHIELGIRTGEIRDPALILGSKLNEGDQASLFEMLKTENKDSAGVDAIISAIGAGHKVAVNPFNSDVTKIADKAYNQFITAVPADKRDQASTVFVQSTGYIPDTLQANLRQGAASKNASELAASLSQADAVERTAPAAFTTIPGSDVQTKLTDYRHLVNDLGMSGDAAAQELLRRNDPAVKVNREVLKPEAEKWVKKLTIGDVTDAFDPGIFSSEPGAGIMPEQSSALLAEYREIATDAYYETNGDEGLAKARAVAEIKTRWNVSHISGAPNLMRLPPEKQYPPIGGNYDYLRANALETATTYAEPLGHKVENVAVWPTAQTRADIEANRPPRYRLFYQYSEDGQTRFDEVLSGPWGVDAAEMQKVSDETGAKFKHDLKVDDEANDIERGAAAKAEAINEDPNTQDFIRALNSEATIGAGRVQADLHRQENTTQAAPVPLTPAEQRAKNLGTSTYDGSQKTGFGNN